MGRAAGFRPATLETNWSVKGSDPEGASSHGYPKFAILWGNDFERGLHGCRTLPAQGFLPKVR